MEMRLWGVRNHSLLGAVPVSENLKLLDSSKKIDCCHADTGIKLYDLMTNCEFWRAICPHAHVLDYWAY